MKIYDLALLTFENVFSYISTFSHLSFKIVPKTNKKGAN